MVHENKLYIGVGQDPEHDNGVGHLWCIDLEKATKARGDVSPELPGTDRARKGGPIDKVGGGLALRGDEEAPTEDDTATTPLAAPVHPPPSWTALSTSPSRKASCTAWMPKRVRNTGSTTWRRRPGVRPYYVDGKVYLGNDKKKVLIFEHGKKKRLLAVHDMGSMVRMTPVATNGVLYIMTENRLYAIATKE